eukprot:1528435-Rhodomonas_salina.3
MNSKANTTKVSAVLVPWLAYIIKLRLPLSNTPSVTRPDCRREQRGSGQEGGRERGKEGP